MAIAYSNRIMPDFLIEALNKGDAYITSVNTMLEAGNYLHVKFTGECLFATDDLITGLRSVDPDSERKAEWVTCQHCQTVYDVSVQSMITCPQCGAPHKD